MATATHPQERSTWKRTHLNRTKEVKARGHSSCASDVKTHRGWSQGMSKKVSSSCSPCNEGFVWRKTQRAMGSGLSVRPKIPDKAWKYLDVQAGPRLTHSILKCIYEEFLGPF